VVKIGCEMLAEEIQEKIILGNYHEGKFKIKEGGNLTRLN